MRDGEEVSTLAPVVDPTDVPEAEDEGAEALETLGEAPAEAAVEAEAVAESGSDE
jgi:hypothetical protein